MMTAEATFVCPQCKQSRFASDFVGRDGASTATCIECRDRGGRMRPLGVAQKRVLNLAREPKSRTRALALAAPPYPTDVVRPRTRGDCEGGERPCPFVSCRYHLYLEVDEEFGNITLRFPDREPDELAETCVLDVADRRGATLDEVGALYNVTRERIRQIELSGRAQAQRYARTRGLTSTFHDLIEVGDERAPGPWDGIGEGGGGAAQPVEVSTSVVFGREAPLDEDALFCERVDRIYERELRQGVPEGWRRPELAAANETEAPSTPEPAPAPALPEEEGHPMPIAVPRGANHTRLLAALREWFGEHEEGPATSWITAKAGIKNDGTTRSTINQLRLKGILRGTGPMLRIVTATSEPILKSLPPYVDGRSVKARAAKKAAKAKGTKKPAKVPPVVAPNSAFRTMLTTERERLAQAIARIDALLEVMP